MNMDAAYWLSSRRQMGSKGPPFSANLLDIAQMIEGDLMKRITGAIFVVAVSLLAGCTPLYMAARHCI
jgi:hypothetical protein